MDGAELAARMREKHKAWLLRCDHCGSPLASDQAGGCLPNDCAQRPLPPARVMTDFYRDFRALLDFIENSDG